MGLGMVRPLWGPLGLMATALATCDMQACTVDGVANLQYHAGASLTHMSNLILHCAPRIEGTAGKSKAAKKS